MASHPCVPTRASRRRSALARAAFDARRRAVPIAARGSRRRPVDRPLGACTHRRIGASTHACPKGISSRARVSQARVRSRHHIRTLTKASETIAHTWTALARRKAHDERDGSRLPRPKRIRRDAQAAIRRRTVGIPSTSPQRSLNVPSALRRQAASRRTRESPRFHRAFTHRAARALHLLQPQPNPARASHAMHAVLRWRQASFAGACRRKQIRGDPRWIVFS